MYSAMTSDLELTGKQAAGKYTDNFTMEGLTMSKKWLWLTIGAVAVVGFVAGMVVAQEEDFDFLPAYYSESYTPTLVEWREVQFNALEGYERYLTDRLVQTSCVLDINEYGMPLRVGTSTTPDWDMYLGDGDFACGDEDVRTTYTEAAEKLADSVRDYFPEIADEDLGIEFFMEDLPVAEWEHGETLVGDEMLKLW